MLTHAYAQETTFYEGLQNHPTLDLRDNRGKYGKELQLTLLESPFNLRVLLSIRYIYTMSFSKTTIPSFGTSSGGPGISWKRPSTRKPTNPTSSR